MTTHYNTGRLIMISGELTYVHMVCQSRSKGNVLPRPKNSRGGIVDIMEDCVVDAAIVFQGSHTLNWISEEIQNWVDKLKKDYREKFASSEILNKKWTLDYDDSLNLEKDSEKWLKAISEYYKKNVEGLLNEKILFTIRDEMKNKLPPGGSDDLSDAIDSILSGLPTPAVMTLNRVAESMVKKLYEKELGIEPNQKLNWGDMIKKLETKIPKNDPILHLLHYRKGNRNTAQHPGKRYSMRDAEKTLYSIQELVDEIYLKIIPKNNHY